MRIPSLLLAAFLTIILMVFSAPLTQANQKTTKLTLEILPALNEAPQVEEITQGSSPGTVRLKILSRPASRLKIDSRNTAPLFVETDSTGTAWVDVPVAQTTKINDAKPYEIRIVEVNEADSTLSKEATVEVKEEFIAPPKNILTAKNDQASNEANPSPNQLNESTSEATSTGSPTLPILGIAALVVALTLWSLLSKPKPTHHNQRPHARHGAPHRPHRDNRH